MMLTCRVATGASRTPSSNSEWSSPLTGSRTRYTVTTAPGTYTATMPPGIQMSIVFHFVAMYETAPIGQLHRGRSTTFLAPSAMMFARVTSNPCAEKNTTATTKAIIDWLLVFSQRRSILVQIIHLGCTFSYYISSGDESAMQAVDDDDNLEHHHSHFRTLGSSSQVCYQS